MTNMIYEFKLLTVFIIFFIPFFLKKKYGHSQSNDEFNKPSIVCNIETTP